MLGQRSKTEIGFTKHCNNVTFSKVQPESPCFCLSKIQQLISKIQQTLRILLHDIQILFRFRIHFLFQDNIFQRTFNQGQRSSYFVSNVGKEINLSMIDFPFFLLFKHFHLTMLLPIIPFFKVEDDTDQTPHEK